MICMTIKSVPEKKPRNAAAVWDGECPVSDLNWSATGEIFDRKSKNDIKNSMDSIVFIFPVR